MQYSASLHLFLKDCEERNAFFYKIYSGLPANPPDFMLGPKKKAKPPPPSPPKRSKFKPPRKRKGDHSDSDEDWTPWTETTQRSSNRGIDHVTLICFGLLV